MGNLTVEKWAVDDGPEVHALSDHGVVMAHVPHSRPQHHPHEHLSTAKWTKVGIEAMDAKAAELAHGMPETSSTPGNYFDQPNSSIASVMTTWPP